MKPSTAARLLLAFGILVAGILVVMVFVGSGDRPVEQAGPRAADRRDDVPARVSDISEVDSVPVQQVAQETPSRREPDPRATKELSGVVHVDGVPGGAGIPVFAIQADLPILNDIREAQADPRRSTRTDVSGRFRFTELPTSRFEPWLGAPGMMQA